MKHDLNKLATARLVFPGEELIVNAEPYFLLRC